MVACSMLYTPGNHPASILFLNASIGTSLFDKTDSPELTEDTEECPALDPRCHNQGPRHDLDQLSQ